MVSPFASHRKYTNLSLPTDKGGDVPDIIEFIVSDKYLNRPTLYPRQATLLKLVFLQTELLTQYDYDVIGEWTELYRSTADQTGEGNHGIVPDILERVEICKAEGRPWFRENVIVVGRRGSKGYMGALAGGYVLWNYHTKADPQGHYGISRDKQLSCQVFAGKKEQAKINQWKDIRDIIIGSKCFRPWLSNNYGESLSLYAPHDQARMEELINDGVDISNIDLASFVIEPKESTVMAARGVASFMQFYDEMAWVVKGVAKNEAKEVYNAATPALDQFGVDAFMWEPSSPWQRVGQFYENYSKALQHDEETGEMSHPEVLMIQLPSWDIYKDWERANDLHVVPQGPRFCRLHRPPQVYDKQMEREEKSNPETFAVERRSHWAAVLSAYLNPDRIAEIWTPWPNEQRPILQQDRGILAITYRAHGDPSKSQANFGFAIAHTEGPDKRGLNHAVFDLIHVWKPEDFDDHRIDYDLVEREIKEFMDAFMPSELTFDQWPMGSTLAHLQKHAREKRYPKQVQVYERPATGPLNWKTYEALKTAMGLNLVHAPFHDQANAELTYLQDLGHMKVEHPTSGPVQTKDVADCIAIVTYELIGTEVTAFVTQSLKEFPLAGAAPGGFPVGGPDPNEEEAISALRNFNRTRGNASAYAGASRRRRR